MARPAKRIISDLRPTVWFGLLLAIQADPASAQLIPIRTIPVFDAHQFEIFPSLRLSMGGVALALPDSLRDPFTHPARGSEVSAPRFLGAPVMYTVSNKATRAAAGRSLPLALVGRSRAWYGGVALALQLLDVNERTFFPQGLQPLACPDCEAAGLDLTRAERTRGNRYAFGMIGRDLASAGLSLGASMFWSGLHAVDGVELLYPRSARIRQDGHALDLRLGALKRLTGDRMLALVLLHHRLDVAHDVVYLDPFWDPGLQITRSRPRLEASADRTETWGLSVEYEHDLPGGVWRLGWLGTANLKSHPDIPDYEIMNVPGDPGRSRAFNLGVGVARNRGTGTLGLDLIFEPIWSHTWVEAHAPVETHDGGVIPAGTRTVDNRFRFTNAILRLGVSDELPLSPAGQALGLQLGFRLHSIHYRLHQRDQVLATSRRQEERWTEWAPTWGLSLRLPAMEVRYQGRAVYGTGGPFGTAGGVNVPESGRDLALVPGESVHLAPMRVLMHQVSLSFPLR